MSLLIQTRRGMLQAGGRSGREGEKVKDARRIVNGA